MFSSYCLMILYSFGSDPALVYRYVAHMHSFFAMLEFGTLVPALGIFTMVGMQAYLNCTGPFGLIAAHGFVDFASPSLLAVYALAAVPLGSIPTTAGFLALSLLHFGRDLGPALSLGMHSLVGLVYLLDQNVAFSLMMAYSLVYHIPGRAAFLESATSGGGHVSPSPLAL